MDDRTTFPWRRPPLGSARLTAILLGVLLTAAPTASRGQAGWYVTPSLGVTEEFDDNIFGSSNERTSDFITRVSLGLTAGFRSEPLTLLATAELGAEFFEFWSRRGSRPFRRGRSLRVGARLQRAALLDGPQRPDTR